MINCNGVGVLGYSARLPGALDTVSFWRLLDQAQCAVTRIPAERFPSERYWHPNRQASGKAVSFAAGIVENAYDFDPGFFGVTRREAVQMDPQQRMLLQVVWEALENAGIPPSSLRGSSTGVFVGASSLDHLQNFTQDAGSTDAQLVTGNTLSIISNRISYLLDLRGPSFTVDTACSSSLVALHQACAAIASGQIDTAIVGGVNFLASPYPFCGFSRAFMLSEQGLCKAFDASGDGYVRGEGAVALVIQSQEAAARLGRRARCRIVGWGTNCDGRTAGLSMPSATSQAALLESVYSDFGLDPEDLAFVEAHGTGTRVGDPVEATALGRALGQHRTAPLPIGSVKTNIGHLEPASGLAGFLKAVLALENDRLPASLHFDTPNPDIPFNELNLAVASEALPLHRDRRQRLAGINSFGFGGANAHIVIADGDQRRPPVARLPRPLMVSAASRQGLQALAASYERNLPNDDTERAAFAAATVWRRDRLDHSAVILSGALDETREALSALATGKSHPALIAANSGGQSGPTVFAFAGNGSQLPGMGQAAFATDKTFRNSMEQTDAIFARQTGWSLIDTLRGDDIGERIKRADVVQPLLFALQLATSDALAAYGVVPSTVLGHSAGEVAAACVCGAITREDALRIIEVRSSFQEPMRGKGTMAALVLPEAEAEEVLSKPEFNQVEIAATNTARSLTLSGPVEAIATFVKHARRKRWPYVRLDIEYPFHSSLLDPHRDDVLKALQDIRPRSSVIPFISTVTGGELAGEKLDAEYWWRNVRERVRFERGVNEALKAHPRVLLEISPAPILTGYLSDIARQVGASTVALASPERNTETRPEPIAKIAASVLCSGSRASLEALAGPQTNEDIELPNYPWQNERIKVEPSPEAETKFLPDVHPLLGMPHVRDGMTFCRHLDVETTPWLADHKVQSAVVFPAAGLLELALAGARQSLGDRPIELRNCQILRPLTFTPSISRTITSQVIGDERLTTVESKARGAVEPASIHARASFSAASSATAASPPPVHGEQRTADAEAVYKLLASYQLNYGPAFRRLARVVQLNDKYCDVEFTAPPEGWPRFLLDPAVVDSAFHATLWLLHGERPEGAEEITFLPTFIERVRLFRPEAAITRARVELTRKPGGTGVAENIWLMDEGGDVVALLSGGRFARVQLTSNRDHPGLYEIRAIPLSRSPVSPMRDIEMDPGALASAAHGLSASQAMLDKAARTALIGNAQSPNDATAAIDALLKTSPELVAEAAACALLAQGGSKAGIASGLAATPRSLSLFGVTQSIVEQVAQFWPAYAPLRVLLVGAADEAVVRRHQDLLPPERGVFAISDVNAARLEQLVARLPSHSIAHIPYQDLAAHGSSFDLILLCDAFGENAAEAFDPRPVGAALAEGGRVLRVSFAENPFSQLIGVSQTDAAFQKWQDVEPLLEATIPGAYGPVRIQAGECRRHTEMEWPIERRTLRLIGLAPDLAAPLSTALETKGVETRLDGPVQHGEDLLFVAQASERDSVERISQTLARLAETFQGCEAGERRLTILVLQDGEDLAMTSALQGFARVAANEYPHIRTRWIAASENALPSDADRLAQEIARTSGETELAITRNGVFGARAIKHDDVAAQNSDEMLQLEIAGQGSLERLRWTSTRRVAPRPGEVEVEVEAAGLNFRDVMWSLGLLPPEALEAGFAGATLGMECAGKIVRVGDGVEHLSVGDEVICFARGALAQYVTSPAFVVARRPAQMNARSAATLPVAFLTSWYSLIHLARVEPGETVLVHGGAGGVGLAAVQILRMLGAHVVATAGSPAKRALLRQLGAAHVLDSRSLEFADAIAAITNGEGVDVVHNSLSGEAMERSIDCLKPFGRFIELGKRDFFANTRIGLRPFRQNLSYFGVDADQLLLGNKQLAGRLFADLMSCFEDGRLSPLPWRSFEAEDATAAFRLMQHSGHIGKIVIAPPIRRSREAKGFTPRKAASYLIVGGLSGLGLALAHRLARQGAGRLVLVSRRGAATPGADAIPAALAALGCQTEIHAVDASDVAQLRSVVDRLPENQPLAGVFHAAMMLDDTAIATLDQSRIGPVLRAKAGVAEALDAITEHLELDAFVMFSSAAAMLGNPGQANYAAANAALDAIARRRRRQGKAALCIGFGAISDIGYLAREQEAGSALMQRLARHSLTGEEALDGLERLLRAGGSAPVTSVYARLDWAALTRDLPVMSSALFDNLRRSSAETGSVTGLAEELRKMDPMKARARVLAELANEIAKIMRIAASEVDTSKGLAELGVDSLMGVELRLAAEERFGVSVPLLSIGAAGSLNDLANLVMKQVLEGAPRESAEDAAAEPAAKAA